MNNFRKNLAVRITIFAAGIAALAGIFWYVRGDVEALNFSIQAARMDMLYRSQAIGNFADLKQDASEAEGNVSVLQNALPTKDSIFIFGEEIGRLAQQRGLMAVFNFGEESPGAARLPGKTEFTVNVAGEYRNVIEFMKALESSRYFTSIKSFDLLSQGVNTTAYQAIIVGDVFYKN